MADEKTLMPDEIYAYISGDGMKYWNPDNNTRSDSVKRTRYTRPASTPAIPASGEVSDDIATIRNELGMLSMYPSKFGFVAACNRIITAATSSQSLRDEVSVEKVAHQCARGHRWNDPERKDGFANCCPSCNPEGRLLQLEKDRDSYAGNIGWLNRENTMVAARNLKLRDENTALREALAYYAEAKNWLLNGHLDPNSSRFSGAYVAEKALCTYRGKEASDAT